MKTPAMLVLLMAGVLGCGASTASTSASSTTTPSEPATVAASPASVSQAAIRPADAVGDLPTSPAPLPPTCGNVAPSFGADACTEEVTVCGDLVGDSTPECIVAFALVYDGNGRREWHIVQRDGEGYRSLTMLYEAEGFTPEEGTPPTIRERRIVARGAWNCGDCGCTEGTASIVVAPEGAESRLSIVEQSVTSDPGECDGP